MNANEPTLEQKLDVAERNLVAAGMIDSFERMKRETARWRDVVDDLKRQIRDRDAEICERTYIANAAASLGDRHAG